MSRRGMEPRFTRSVTFTVRAFPNQAKRWEAAAALQSGAAVGDWLGEVADAYLKDVTRSGKPLPLKWYHAGSSRGLAEAPHFCYSLVHRPTRRIVGTFGRRKDCEMLASETHAAPRKMAKGPAARPETSTSRASVQVSSFMRTRNRELGGDGPGEGYPRRAG